MSSIQLQRPRLDGSSEFNRCNLSGDGTVECALISLASTEQEAHAAATVEAMLPGLGVADLTSSCGTSTPRVLRLAANAIDAADVIARLDRYVWQGDIGARRGAVVDPVTGRSHPADPSITCPRPGDSVPLCGEPFAVAEQLQATRTLVLNDAQQRLGAPVADLVDALSVALRAHAQVNAYVSYGEATGFGVHWDDHDVFVVQLDGRKYWEIQQPLEVGSISGITPLRGSGEAVWSGVLEPGSVLYIPRGWAHGVSGFAEERSVHLTYSVRRLMAIDMLAMLDLEQFGQAWGTCTLGDLEHGAGAWRASLTSCPRNGPLEAIDALADGFRGWDLLLTLFSGAVFFPDNCDEESLSLSGNSRTFTIPRAHAAGFARALEAGWFTINDIAASMSDDHPAALDLITHLSQIGLIRVRSQGTP